MSPVLVVLMDIALVTGGIAALRDGMATKARRRRAQRVIGQVIKVEYNSECQAFPQVAYTVEGGRVVQAAPQSSSNLRRFSVGQEVWVHYDPLKPEWMELEGLPSGATVGFIIGPLLWVAALVCTVAAYLFA